MNIKKIEFNSHKDNRGQLVAIEELRDVPFEIKRVYYMYDTYKGFVRGKHAHKTLKQVLICICGSCKVSLFDGKETETIVLEKANEGLYIEENVWREMYDFSENAVLMVLASEYYNEDDYIRDFNKFMEYVGDK